MSVYSNEKFKQYHDVAGIYVLEPLDESSDCGATRFKIGMAKRLYQRLKSYLTCLVKFKVRYLIIYDQVYYKHAEDNLKTIIREIEPESNFLKNANERESEWLEIRDFPHDKIDKAIQELCYHYPKALHGYKFGENGHRANLACHTAGTDAYKRALAQAAKAEYIIDANWNPNRKDFIKIGNRNYYKVKYKGYALKYPTLQSTLKDLGWDKFPK